MKIDQTIDIEKEHRSMKIDQTIDCIGVFCPMPIIKTKLALDVMKSGEVLEILADDAGFEKDLPAWCSSSGEKFIEIKKEGSTIKGYVMKK